MYKTKLGLSNFLVAGIIYLLALLVSYSTESGSFATVGDFLRAFPLMIFVGYVLSKETDLWLKASAVKAVLVVLFFTLVPVALSFVQNLLDFINFFLEMGKATPIRDGAGIMSFLILLTKICEKVFLLLLALFAFKGKTVKMPVIDGIIRKHIAQ